MICYHIDFHGEAIVLEFLQVMQYSHSFPFWKYFGP